MAGKNGKKAKGNEKKRRVMEKNLSKDIIHNKRILNLFVDHLKKIGVVGEENVAKLHYLALTSRFLDMPVSVVVKGSSTAGKSFVLKQVLEHFPKGAYHKMTGATEKALVRSDLDLKHKFLIIEEADGFSKGFLDYTIRILLSEGKVEYLTPEKTITLEGPTGLISTTTKVKLNTQNETRCLSVEADESPEQTAKILKAKLAKGYKKTKKKIDAEKKTWKKWLAVQYVLANAEHSVRVPYAPALETFLPKTHLRIRRDVDKIISLIEAHALLHQFNRKKDSEGDILATMQDYSMVRKIIKKPLALTLDLKERDIIIEIVNAVEALTKGSSTKGVPSADVAKKMGVSPSTISRNLKELTEKGYIIKSKLWKKGQAFKLVLGEKLPSGGNFLPTKDELKKQYKKDKDKKDKDKKKNKKKVKSKK